MTDEISNKTLAIILIAAIAVSLGGTIFSLNKLARLSPITGYITTPTGTATVNVSQTASLRFSVSSLNFGIGSVNTTAGNQYCTMSSASGTAGTKDAINRCISFNAASTFNSLEIENDGNRNLTLTMSSDKLAAAFIGGTSPVFSFYVSNNESTACALPYANVSTWNVINTTEMSICGGSGLDYTDTKDSMDIHLNISIPYDSLTGQQTATITVTGTAV